MFSVFNIKRIVNVTQVSDFPIDHWYDDPFVPVETVDCLHFFQTQTGIKIQLMKTIFRDLILNFRILIKTFHQPDFFPKIENILIFFNFSEDD